MELGYINSEQMQYFKNLLLPQTVEAIENGESITALGIVKDSIACGAIAGFITEGKFYIDSLYVAPGYRRQGAGRMLLEAVMNLLEEEDMVNGVEIRYTVTEEEHKTIAPFLEAMEFVKEEDERFCKFEENHFQREYCLEQMKDALAKAGMEFIKALDADTHEEVTEISERIYCIVRECGK